MDDLEQKISTEQEIAQAPEAVETHPAQPLNLGEVPPIVIVPKTLSVDAPALLGLATSALQNVLDSHPAAPGDKDIAGARSLINFLISRLNGER